MMEPAEFDFATPTITLAGKDWPIPETLVWRDLKKCRRELLEMNGRLNAAAAASEAAAPADETRAEREQRHVETMAQTLNDLSNEDYDRLIVGPIHAALQAHHPSLTLADFQSWPTTENDRQFAWLKVRRHSGLFVFSEDAPSSGE